MGRDGHSNAGPAPGEARRAAIECYRRAPVTPELLFPECVDLRELLTTTVPIYAMKRQELCMPATTSPLIARFWETVGWCSDRARPRSQRRLDISLTGYIDE